MTRVVNLATGEERHYTLAARDAVVAAWEQARGNWNTWNYPTSAAPVRTGKYTVGAGDWCVLLRVTL